MASIPVTKQLYISAAKAEEFRVIEPVKLANKATIDDELEHYRAADVRFYGYDMYGNETDDGDYFDAKRGGATLQNIYVWANGKPEAS